MLFKNVNLIKCFTFITLSLDDLKFEKLINIHKFNTI